MLRIVLKRSIFGGVTNDNLDLVKGVQASGSVIHLRLSNMLSVVLDFKTRYKPIVAMSQA